MASESWVLGGVTLTSGNFRVLEATVDPPKERAEWIGAADSEGAALVRQPLHENRVVTMKLRVPAQASMDAALDQMALILDQFKLASASMDGVALVWTPASSTRSRTFDVLDGTITELPIAVEGLGSQWFRGAPVFTVEMTCKPYWRGAEVLTSTASGSTPLITLEIPNVPGDVPALGRLIVTDTATQNRRHVEWGIEGRSYNAATSLILDSDSFVTSGFGGTQTTLSGAYDPGASGNSIVQMNMFGNPTAMFSTGNLSHVGTFRVKARVYTDVLTAKLRFVWQEGDGPFAGNPWKSIPNSSAYFDVDLGTVNIDAKTSGTQRWSGRIEAFSAGTGTLFCDYLLFIPVAEGYGKARGQWANLTAASVVAYDQFTGTTGGTGLTGRTATLGGTWTTSGSTTDFAFTDEFVDIPTEAINRATVSDSGNGRFAVLGSTNYTDMGGQARVAWTGWPSGVETGVIIRWVDASNYIAARLNASADDIADFEIVQRVAGTLTMLMQKPAVSLVSRQPVYIKVVGYATGRITAILFDTDGVTQLAILDTIQTVAATAGALASGKPAVYDKNASATGASRYIDDVQVFIPQAEPVAIYSGRSLEISHSKTERSDSAGVYYGRPQSYNGSRFLVPTGTSRVAVKARRNDVDVDSDSQVTDATQLQVGYQPRGVAVPRE